MVSLLIGVLAAPLLVQPAVDPPLVDMARRVFVITGADPRECGRHPLRDVNERREGPTREQLEASLRCVSEAIQTGQRFWTFVELPGIDSWVAHGFLRTASGDLRHFVYDSAPCGGPRCQPELTLEPCARPGVTSTPGGTGFDFACDR
jgi:hypothetical protein